MHPHISKKRLGAVVTLFVSFLIAGGCGKKEEGKVIQQGDGVTVTQNGDKVSVAGPEGSAEYQAGKNVELPQGFPADVPTYPGMQLEFAGKAGAMFTVNGKSADAISKVSEGLKTAIAKQGWSQVMSMDQSAAGGAPGQMMSYSKSNRVLNVVLAANDQGTNISITTGSQ